jgi:sugar phosphate isomerase/epimerase
MIAREGNAMTDINSAPEQGRRAFLKELAGAGGALLMAEQAGRLTAQTAAAPDWKKQMGLETYTVRDLEAKDFEGTLAKVAEIGYKEIEPATSYGRLDPKAFRALMDRLGLTAVSTHVGATDNADLEKQLEGYQTMGIRYTEINGGGRGGAGGGRAAAPTPAGAAAGARGAGAAAGQRSPMTEESVKQRAQEINRHGEIAKKFGLKMLIHNHTGEFELLEGGKKTQYDVLLAETDPALVAMQLDIGWASVAGQDIVAMFKKSPGRFECWHVKDATNIKFLPTAMPQNERMQNAYLVPVGQGQVDYKTIFASAAVAGMKHFCIEQDNADAWGDSVLAAKASITGLQKMLS